MANKTLEDLLERAREAKRESRYLDFKEAFDPTSAPEFIELVKDLGAMANSGGGVLVIGVRNNATLSGAELRPVLDLDPAVIVDKVARYTGEQFAGFSVHEVERDSDQVAAIVVDAAETPLAFNKPGTYPVAGGKQKTAFAVGTVYARHGAKSEPATSQDLREFIERRLEQIRESWLGNIREVIAAPPDSEVALYERSESDEDGRPSRVRLTNEPGAPVFGRVSADQTHPYRQKELVREVSRRLPRKLETTPYDIQAVRAAHDLNDQTAPDFCHQPKYTSQQYSDVMVEWIVDQHAQNPDFFSEARTVYRDMLRG